MSTDDIRSRGDAFLRDFAVDGLPASGAHSPAKATGRLAFQTVADEIDTVAAVAASAVAGINWTPHAIRVRSTGNVTIASGLENGDTLNGVTLAAGDHVFLGSQSAPAENGIYTVVASGAASRATFADSAAELARIGFVVQSGTAGAGERWMLPLAAAAITVGSTALNFAPAGVEVDYSDVVEALEEVVDGGLGRVTTVSYGGMESASSVVTPGNSFNYGAGFSGWAVVADTPASVSFNAVLISRIARASGLAQAQQLSSVRVVVRTHATAPEGAGTDIVAQATAYVLQGEGDLVDLLVLLRDPLTDAPITVTEADLDARVLIGYQGLLPNGSGADQVGVKFATARDVALADAEVFRVSASANALTDAWTTNATADLDVSLLLLDSPEETVNTALTERAALARGLPASEVTVPTPFEPLLPPRWFGVQGVVGRMQTWGMTAAGTAKAAFATGGGVGRTMDDRWAWTADIGITPDDAALPVSVLDTDFMTERARGSVDIKVVGPTAAAAKAINLVCMGDSKTNDAQYTARLLAHNATYPNGVQTTLIGTKGAGSNKHEGRDGWKVENYYEDTSAGSDTNPFIDGAGKFDASFWQTDNSLTVPDAVFIELGTNDVFAATSDAEAHLVMSRFNDQTRRIIGLTADAAVGSWKELNPDIVTILATCPPPASTQDGFGLVHYTNGQTMWRYKRNAAIATKRLIDAFSGLESDKVFIFPYHLVVDPVAGFDGATDGIHENATGYGQMGDALWAMLNVLAVEGEFD